MEVIIKQDAEAASLLGAKLVASVIRKNPSSVLGLATGSTPLKLYKNLIEFHKKEGLDFSSCTTFNLDEYVGLSPDHPSSYHYFMNENLFRHINVPQKQVHIPDGQTQDVPLHCLEYETKMRQAGGVDLQILGIGTDGHIGFNEPSSSLSSRTRIKTLTEKTLTDNASFFKSGETMPHHVLTMGIGTIMEAKSCLLLAFGEKKADIVAQMVEGPITSMVPASALQWHRSATVIVDEAASTKLKRLEYYRWVYQSKPEWQRFE
ncbi:MAG: glucosamine-6-phosphate deaminase [Verrucomicrobiota bacterium]|nr:glucosamine-6-phosphate deaminase [Verrucomicrobiota bacterium]